MTLPRGRGTHKRDMQSKQPCDSLAGGLQTADRHGREGQLGSLLNSAAPASKMSEERARERANSCSPAPSASSVRPPISSPSHRTFFARSPAPDFPSAWTAPTLSTSSAALARSLAPSLSLWQCSLGRRGRRASTTATAGWKAERIKGANAANSPLGGRPCLV